MTFKALPDDKAHKIIMNHQIINETIDIGKREPDSPMFDNESNLKLEDLSNKQKNYEQINRIRKLQVTDENSNIKYEEKFKDENIRGRNFSGERDDEYMKIIK